MSDNEYKNNPRNYALSLVDDGLVDPKHLLVCMLKWMSNDDVRKALDSNELSPRFVK